MTFVLSIATTYGFYSNSNMNILIPDSWLREYLKTNAKPADIQRCLSLCGPSIERTETVGNDIIYDIEVTTNRVDSFSVYGIAREAAAILPEFGFSAKLLPLETSLPNISKLPKLDMRIKDPDTLCRRILAIKLTNVTLAPSPKWLQDRLTKVGQRPLNNIIDITNYVMWETGHPCHAFDYDRLKEKKIIVREAKYGEHMITLDGKRHTLRGGELVFDDGNGEIIDLPGVMGTQNTVVTSLTKNVLLFVENSDPAHIRSASMGLGIRTQAATINEKGPDPEDAYTAIVRAASLACEVAGGTIGSQLFDTYPGETKPKTVSVSHLKLVSYLGADITPKRTMTILHNLGFSATYKSHGYHVIPPSWRLSDCQIPEDVIEEIARIYGYHNIPSKLPVGEPPVVLPDSALAWEEELKIRLRDWGYTEIVTYSMLSEEQMRLWGLDTQKTYKIANPLSSEWVYMRPKLWPGVLTTIKQNMNTTANLRIFELGMVHEYREHDLPKERPTLSIAWTGHKFLEAKGLAEAIFDLFGIPFPEGIEQKNLSLHAWNDKLRLLLGDYGSVSEVNHDFLATLGISKSVTFLSLFVDTLIENAKPTNVYTPISAHPPIVEDLSFIVPERFTIGPLITTLKATHPLVSDVTLLDVHENTRTLHITYQDPKKNLTDEEIMPVRNKLVEVATKKFGVSLKTL